MFMDPALETTDPAVLDREAEPTFGEQVSSELASNLDENTSSFRQTLGWGNHGRVLQSSGQQVF